MTPPDVDATTTEQVETEVEDFFNDAKQEESVKSGEEEASEEEPEEPQEAGDGPGGEGSEETEEAGEGSPEGEGEEETPVETEPKTEPDKFSVTIDGEKIEVTQEELVKGYQEHRGSGKRFQEAADLKKRVNAFLAGIQQDPIGALRQTITHQMGGNKPAAEQRLRQIVEGYLAGLLEEEALPEPDRRARQLDRDSQELQRQRQELDQQRTQMAEEESVTRRANEGLGIMRSVFEKAGIEEKSFDGEQISDRLARMVRAGENITRDLVEGLALKAVSSRSDSTLAALGNMSVEDLVKSQPDLVKKIRKADLEKLKKERTTKSGAASTSTTSSTKARRRSPQKGKGPPFSTAAELSDWKLRNRRKR